MGMKSLRITAGQLATAGTFGQKTESKTPATVRGRYMGENRKADPSPTFANGASGFGMTTAVAKNRSKGPATVRGLYIGENRKTDPSFRYAHPGLKPGATTLVLGARAGPG